MAMQKGWKFGKDAGRAKPVKAMPQVSSAPAKSSGYESVNIRAIKNGYLVEKSSSDGKGRYHSETIYSATKPKLDV